MHVIVWKHVLWNIMPSRHLTCECRSSYFNQNNGYDNNLKIHHQILESRFLCYKPNSPINKWSTLDINENKLKISTSVPTSMYQSFKCNKSSYQFYWWVNYGSTFITSSLLLGIVSDMYWHFIVFNDSLEKGKWNK